MMKKKFKTIQSHIHHLCHSAQLEFTALFLLHYLCFTEHHRDMTSRLSHVSKRGRSRWNSQGDLWSGYFPALWVLARLKRSSRRPGSPMTTLQTVIRWKILTLIIKWRAKSELFLWSSFPQFLAVGQLSANFRPTWVTRGLGNFG